MSSNVPTLRSLAAALGLSRTTVSDALRGSPRVDPATAVRVRKAARDAGYRRNPLAGALMSELRRSRGTTFRGVLAAVDLNEPDVPVSSRFHRELVLGAENRATELGFKVEKFFANRGGLTVHRLDSILQSRGIHGVMLLPSWDEPDLSKLDWSRYAGIYTDYMIERPALHSVCSDHYRSLMGVLQRLVSLDYRRPGIFLTKHHDERLQHRWEAAFRVFLGSNPHIEAVPPLITETTPVSEQFITWFRRYQPDVVIGHNTEAIEWMENAGAKVPATHGFVCLNVLTKTCPTAGLDLLPRMLGARAAELLIAQLQRNETGIPDWPVTTTLSARWVDGPTVRRGENPGPE